MQHYLYWRWSFPKTTDTHSTDTRRNDNYTEWENEAENEGRHADVVASITAEDGAEEAAGEAGEAEEVDEEESPCPLDTITFATTNWTSPSTSTTTASRHSPKIMTMIRGRLDAPRPNEPVEAGDVDPATEEVAADHVDEVETADRVEEVKRMAGETRNRRC